MLFAIRWDNKILPPLPVFFSLEHFSSTFSCMEPSVCREVGNNSCNMVNSSYYVNFFLHFQFILLFLFPLVHKMATQKFLHTSFCWQGLLPISCKKGLLYNSMIDSKVSQDSISLKWCTLLPLKIKKESWETSRSFFRFFFGFLHNL